MVRACEVAPVLVQLMSVEWGCCGFFFFLPLPFDCSESLSEVAASVACWSLSGGGIGYICGEIGYWVWLDG